MPEYIDREVAIKLIAEDRVEVTPMHLAIGNAVGGYTIEQVFGSINQACDRHIESIKSVPSADVAPVLKSHWYWDEDGMDWGIGAWCCDNCKSRAETWWALDKKYNPLRCSGGKFCGNCGADMRGDP